jgi:hypothetical protein
MAIALGKTISNETLLLIWLKCPTCWWLEQRVKVNL